MMDRKKVLIISGSFYPVNSPRSFRTTELVKELARQQHEITLLFPFKNYDYNSLHYSANVKLINLGPLRFKEIKLTGNKIEMVIKRLIRRILLLLFEYPDIELMCKVSKCLRNQSGYDLIISIAVPYPIHWGVAWARSDNHRIGKTWVADCGDPYMGCRTDSFKKLFYFKYIEKWFCRKTDYISVPNQDHYGQYYPEFLAKLKSIPQGFRLEDSKLFTSEIKHEIPTFAFAGVLLKDKRDPKNLLEYLATIQTNFRFILYTESIQILKPYLSKLGDRIEIRKYVPREVLVYELSKMDFLINIEFHSSVRSNSPSKLIDYAITRRPILSLSMENINKRSINEFLAGDYSGRLILRDIDRFRIENVVYQFLELIQ